MRKAVVFLMFLVLFSAIPYAISETTNKQDIVIDSQIKEVYNLGDRVPVKLKISSTTETTDKLSVDLVCEGHEEPIMFRRAYEISSAETKTENADFALKNFDNLKKLIGSCKIKASFGDSSTTKEFELTDKLEAGVKEHSTNIKPGENLIVEGDVLKQNPSQDGFNGFYSFRLELNGNKSAVTAEGMVENGFFTINTTLPKKLAAGDYEGIISVYDKNSEGEKANQGKVDFSFSVAQVPTNLEVFIEEDEIKPAGKAEIKAILHDQTGKNIPKTSTITIFNPAGRIILKENRQTGESLNFELESNSSSGRWNVSAISEGKTAESGFEVLENKETKVNLVNNTVFIENTGNVPYNDTVTVRIGDKTVDVSTSLETGETKKYYLEAPDGNYTVEVMADGKRRVQRTVQLTGRSIDVKENLSGSFIRNPVVWGFVILVLGVVLYIVFKKGYKRSFFGRKIHGKQKKKTSEKSEDSENSKEKQDKANEAMNQGILPEYNNKAELSLSIKGNKQDANLVCLKINNYDEIKKNQEGVKETLQKIVKEAEHNKAYIYEANENIFFIFAPEITKTFKNEKTAIQTARKIESELRNHNKYFKQRIDFGLSVNRGEIVVKEEKKKLLFMSVGKLTTSAKKLASLSKGETLLTKEINEKLNAEIKTEKGEDKKNKIEFYRVKEIKDRSKNQKFINEFVKRYKEDGQKSNEKKE